LAKDREVGLENEGDTPIEWFKHDFFGAPIGKFKMHLSTIISRFICLVISVLAKK